MPVPAQCNGKGCATIVLLKVKSVNQIDHDNVAIVLECQNGHLHCWPVENRLWKLWKEQWLKE